MSVMLRWPGAMACLLLGAMLLVAAASRVAGQEWSRFRGPNGQGHAAADAADTVPVDFTEKDFNWKVEVPGVGHSSPVLWGDRVFLVSADPQSGERLVLCFDVVDGTQRWKKAYPADAHHVHVQNSFASSTPAVDRERLYVAWATPQAITLVAFSHDGAELWQRGLGPFVSEHGFATSPVVYNGLVFLGNDQDGDSSLHALDARSGDIRWTVARRHTGTRQNASYATPIIYQPPDDRPEQLITSGWAHGISGIDPNTGKTLWETGKYPQRPVGSPVITNSGLILANNGISSGNNSVLAVRPPSREGDPPQEAYRLGRGISPYVTTMLAVKDLVILWGDGGIVHCVDADSGRVHWTQRVGGNFSGSPILVGDRVYCVSAEGDVVVLAASDQYQLLARVPLGELCRSTPAVAQGRMYIRTAGHLMSLGGKRQVGSE